MTTNKISITRALTTLKTLSDRIAKARSEIRPVLVGRGDKFPIPNTSPDKWGAQQRVVLQSYNDLVQYHQKLKAAIVASNAVTVVTIGSKQMTVAEAISRKTTIQFDKDFLTHLKHQFVTATASYEQMAIRSHSEAQAAAQQLYAGDTKNKADEIQKYANNYILENAPKQYDAIPGGLPALIAKLEAELNEFLTNVDVALSESNARTEIEV